MSTAPKQPPAAPEPEPEPEGAVPIANATFTTRKTGAAPVPAQSRPAAPNSTFASRRGGKKQIKDGENKAVKQAATK